MKPRFTVYQDKERWIPLFNWFWITSPNDTPDPMGHGPYPARWLAQLSARWHTRGRRNA